MKLELRFEGSWGEFGVHFGGFVDPEVRKVRGAQSGTGFDFLGFVA